MGVQSAAYWMGSGTRTTWVAISIILLTTACRSTAPRAPLDDVAAALPGDLGPRFPHPTGCRRNTAQLGPSYLCPGCWLDDFAADHEAFYSTDILGVPLFEGLALGAILANTDLDQGLRDWYQEDARSPGTDGLSKIMKPLGEPEVMVPVLLASVAWGEWNSTSPEGDHLAEWGNRSLRGMLVGAPAMLFLQAATGGSRPDEEMADSTWRPFEDAHGVSGHAFIGAVPFITAAKMTEDPWLKTEFYLASTFNAWSRINDDAHYPSQVFLGWWLAYLACTAVDRTECHRRNWTVMPVAMSEGMGIEIAGTW